MKAKILAGITKDNELYFMEIEKQTEKHNYFAMSGSTYSPITLDDAIEKNREILEDDKTYWKMAVEDDKTELGFYDWVDEVIDIDGNISMLDIDSSLTVETEGTEYLFECRSGGQHQEKELTHYFIDKSEYSVLMSIWDTYHLKSDIKMSVLENKVMENMFELGYFKTEKTQNIEALTIEAIKIINNLN